MVAENIFVIMSRIFHSDDVFCLVLSEMIFEVIRKKCFPFNALNKVEYFTMAYITNF